MCSNVSVNTLIHLEEVKHQQSTFAYVNMKNGAENSQICLHQCYMYNTQFHLCFQWCRLSFSGAGARYEGRALTWRIIQLRWAPVDIQSALPRHLPRHFLE